MTTNGVLLAEQAAALKEAGPPPRDRQPRHAAARALPRADALRRPSRASSPASTRPPRPAASPRSRSTRSCMRGVNDDELVAAARARARAGAPRSASSSTWTSAARRAGRRERVVSRAEMLGRARRALRRDRADRRDRARRRPSASACPTARLRHHRLDDGALLPRLRPQPPDRRRPLVPLPLRGARDRPARAAARRRDRRDEIRELLSVGVAPPRGPRRRGAARVSPSARRCCLGSSSSATRTWRCTPAGAESRTTRSPRGEGTEGLPARRTTSPN